MPTYVLLFRAPKAALQGAARSPDAVRQSLERWRAWEAALREGGHDPAGAQLEPGGRVLRGASKAVEEGPVGEELVGGYFTLKAASLDEAAALAAGCPVLGNGGTVEVRPAVGS
jgi:hypothetical protein